MSNISYVYLIAVRVSWTVLHRETFDSHQRMTRSCLSFRFRSETTDTIPNTELTCWIVFVFDFFEALVIFSPECMLPVWFIGVSCVKIDPWVRNDVPQWLDHWGSHFHSMLDRFSWYIISIRIDKFEEIIECSIAPCWSHRRLTVRISLLDSFAYETE